MSLEDGSGGIVVSLTGSKRLTRSASTVSFVAAMEGFSKYEVTMHAKMVTLWSDRNEKIIGKIFLMRSCRHSVNVKSL